jgi:hypothetical protein
MSPQEEFVTADDVARHLKLTRRRVLEAARQSLIPAHPIRFGGRRSTWRFKLREVDEAIASGAPKPALKLRESASRTIVVGSPRSRRG